MSTCFRRTHSGRHRLKIPRNPGTAGATDEEPAGEGQGTIRTPARAGAALRGDRVCCKPARSCCSTERIHRNSPPPRASPPLQPRVTATTAATPECRGAMVPGKVLASPANNRLHCPNPVPHLTPAPGEPYRSAVPGNIEDIYPEQVLDNGQKAISRPEIEYQHKQLLLTMTLI